jgi:S1-C subfamily serine protease
LLAVASAFPRDGDKSVKPPVTTIDNIATAPELGLVVDKNLQIADIVTGSAAQQAGFQTGDILEELGNAPITSPGNVMQAVRQTISQSPGQEITLTLRRGKAEMSIQVLPTTPKSRPGQPTPTPVPNDYGYI